VITEALQWIRDHIVDDHDPVHITNAEPHGWYYFRADANTPWVLTREKHAPRLYKANDAQSFISMVLEVVARGAEVYRPIVFVGHSRVCCILNETGRRDELIVWELIRTTEFLSLEALVDHPGQTFNQAELIDQLRFSIIRPGLDNREAEALVAALRKLTFKKGDSGTYAMEHQNVAMSREHSAKIVEPLPDHVLIPVTVYESHSYYRTVACGVRALVDEARFRLTPLPGQIDSIKSAACFDIAEHLRKDLAEIPVVEGTP
jgi:hypothetical protein